MGPGLGPGPARGWFSRRRVGSPGEGLVLREKAAGQQGAGVVLLQWGWLLGRHCSRWLLAGTAGCLVCFSRRTNPSGHTRCGCGSSGWARLGHCIMHNEPICNNNTSKNKHKHKHMNMNMNMNTHAQTHDAAPNKKLTKNKNNKYTSSWPCVC